MATADYGSVQQREQLIQEPEPVTNRNRSASRTRASSHIDIPLGGSNHDSDAHEHSHEGDDGSFKAAVFGFSTVFSRWHFVKTINFVQDLYTSSPRLDSSAACLPSAVSLCGIVS